jgi:hypothetical protein
VTPSLSSSLEEIKRGKRKKEEEREKEPRQTEVSLYPKQVRIVQEAHEKIREHGRGGNASTACRRLDIREFFSHPPLPKKIEKSV